MNLIWRHLATFPGALHWAWEVVRPFYMDGIIRREVAVFRSSFRLPEVTAPPPEVFAAAGLGSVDLPRIRDVLDTYDRTNPMALIALLVVQQRLGHSETGGADERLKAKSSVPQAAEPVLELPPSLRLDELTPPVAQLVLRLNRFGTTRQDPVLASMYRNLAHWPGYLALAWLLLAPLDASGALGSAIEDALQQAGTRAAAIGAGAPMPRAVLPAALRPTVSDAIERFTSDAIARMVVVCGVLRRAGVGG